LTPIGVHKFLLFFFPSPFLLRDFKCVLNASFLSNTQNALPFDPRVSFSLCSPHTPFRSAGPALTSLSLANFFWLHPSTWAAPRVLSSLFPSRALARNFVVRSLLLNPLGATSPPPPPPFFYSVLSMTIDMIFPFCCMFYSPAVIECAKNSFLLVLFFERFVEEVCKEAVFSFPGWRSMLLLFFPFGGNLFPGF